MWSLSVPVSSVWCLEWPWGVSSKTTKALAGLKGVCKIANDVHIYGCGETHEQAEKDHDENLYHFLVRVREVKLKLKPAKWVFKTKKVMFMEL